MLSVMKKALLKNLSLVGLTEDEAAAYGALLELGEGTVLDIAKKAGANRTTLYPILDQLKNRGLVSLSKTKKRTVYTPESPKVFLENLQGTVGRLTKDFEKLAVGKRGNRPRVFFYDGAEGFKKVWKILLDSGVKEYLILTDPREMSGFVRERYITDWVIKEKVRLGIKSRQIAAYSELTKEIILKDAKENRVSKILPHIYKVPVTTIIFGDNVAFISTAMENYIMLVVNSEALARTQRAVFEALWDMLPAPK
jgi:sugar-specific transcriptional regulator TrmB